MLRPCLLRSQRMERKQSATEADRISVLSEAPVEGKLVEDELRAAPGPAAAAAASSSSQESVIGAA